MSLVETKFNLRRAEQEKPKVTAGELNAGLVARYHMRSDSSHR